MKSPVYWVYGKQDAELMTVEGKETRKATHLLMQSSKAQFDHKYKLDSYSIEGNLPLTN